MSHRKRWRFDTSGRKQALHSRPFGLSNAAKAEPFRLRFPLFNAFRSTGSPSCPPDSARSFPIPSQKWGTLLSYKETVKTTGNDDGNDGQGHNPGNQHNRQDRILEHLTSSLFVRPHRISLWAGLIPCKSGTHWVQHSVNSILGNEVYLGKIRWKRDPTIRVMENGQLVKNADMQSGEIRHLQINLKHEPIGHGIGV